MTVIMDSLPVELLSRIIELLDVNIIGARTESLINYALVCKAWQQVVERFTFRDLALKSTELDTFAHLYSIGTDTHRQDALRFLKHIIILPSHSEKPWVECSAGQRTLEKQRNNAAFTQAFEDLFTLLDSWRPTAASYRSIRLHNWQIHSEPHDPVHPKSPRSELKINSSHNIPQVRCITELNLHYHGRRPMTPGAAAIIASRLPNFETLDLRIPEEYEIFNSVARRRRRYGMMTSCRTNRAGQDSQGLQILQSN